MRLDLGIADRATVVALAIPFIRPTGAAFGALVEVAVGSSAHRLLPSHTDQYSSGSKKVELSRRPFSPIASVMSQSLVPSLRW